MTSFWKNGTNVSNLNITSLHLKLISSLLTLKLNFKVIRGEVTVKYVSRVDINNNGKREICTLQ